MARPYEWSVIQAGVDNRLERLGAVAPHGVHLEIAAVRRARRCCPPGQDVLDGSAAQEVPAKLAKTGNGFFLPCLRDCALDECGVAVVNQLAGNAIRRWTNAGNRAERIGFDERRDLPIDLQHGLRRALVAPAPL
jgi:hypothetical protein